MESQRQLKFSRLIQKEISEIFQQDKMGIVGKHFFTIVDVRMSPDLSIAKIYVSFMLEKEKEETFAKIVDHKSEIRNQLGLRIGKQVRIIPELLFFIDEVEENAARIEEILKNLNIPPSSDEGETGQ